MERFHILLDHGQRRGVLMSLSGCAPVSGRASCRGTTLIELMAGIAILAVMLAQTGAIIRKVAPCPSGLARIEGWIDSATNNTVSYVYGGDLYGNLWRFNLGGVTSGGGTGTVQSLATLADGSGNRQPITSKPELGKISGQRVVYVGTGAYLGVSDITTAGVQSIYAIKDTLATASSSLYGSPRANTCSASVTGNCFVRQVLSDSGFSRYVSSTVSYTTSLLTMNGWYEDLPKTGERINTDPTLQLGVLV